MIEKSMNNPFMSRKNYKEFAQDMDITFRTEGLKSDYAELFRQILQEGALTDPQTAFNLRRQIIEGRPEDGLGKDAYERIFTLTGGQILMDGISGKQYSITKGEGQLLGEVVMSGVERNNRRYLGGRKKTWSGDGAGIRDHITNTIGYSNETDKMGNDTGC